MRMERLVRAAFAIGGIAVLSVAQRYANPNSWSVVVDDGPNAGAYIARVGDDISCFHYKKRQMLSATFRNYEAANARTIAQGRIEIDDSDAAGSKSGDLNVAFGSSTKFSAIYNVYKVPITITSKGKRVELTGSGKTEDGIQIRITTSCAEVEQL
jgi:hypothetical protein